MSLESLSIQTMTRQIKFIRSDKKLSVIVVVAGILVSILEKKSRVLMEELPNNYVKIKLYNFSLPVFCRFYSHCISIRRLSVTNIFHCRRKQLTYHEVMDAVFSRHKMCS